ncbi:hypothetical protein ACN47E_007170 [Coniothyrium glycines]
MLPSSVTEAGQNAACSRDLLPLSSKSTLPPADIDSEFLVNQKEQSQGESQLANTIKTENVPSSSPLSSPPSSLPEFSLIPNSEAPQPSSQSSPLSEEAERVALFSIPASEGSLLDSDPEVETNMARPRISQKNGSAGKLKAAQKPNETTRTKRKGVTKRKAPKPARPVTVSTRPSRNRKAPERYWEVPENQAPKALSNTKGASKVFDSTFITTNSTSRLGKADVYRLLLEEPAWTSLSAQQQKELITMLPQTQANSVLLAKIESGETEGTRPATFALSNDCFRTDVAKFKEDLKNGHLAKTWQVAAEQAVTERAAGMFDEWKTEEAERWWGQKSK